MNAKLKNLNLEQVVEGITRTVRELKGEARKPASYAAKVKAPGPSKLVIQAVKKTRHAVIISPREGSCLMSSEATKDVLMENLAPAKQKLRISGLKKISNNRVVVETTTKEEMDRVLKNEKLQAAGRISGLLTKKRPMLIVYDVPAQLDEEEFLAKHGAHDSIHEILRSRRVFPTRRANSTLHSTSRQNPTRTSRSGNYLALPCGTAQP